MVVSAEGVSTGHDEIQGLDREEVPFAGASWLKKKKNGLARYPSKAKIIKKRWDAYHG